jgi:DNA-directed RNA polymerase specialized sigma subunit
LQNNIPSIQESVRGVMNLAASIKKKFPNEEIGDMISDGWIGFHNASKRYNPERGVSFWCYVSRRVRGAILDGIEHRKKFYFPINNKSNCFQVSVECFGEINPNSAVCSPEISCAHVFKNKYANDETLTREQKIQRMKDMVNMRKRGMMYKEIAQVYGCTTANVFDIIKRATKGVVQS